jgi:hypothetical protein
MTITPYLNTELLYGNVGVWGGVKKEKREGCVGDIAKDKEKSFLIDFYNKDFIFQHSYFLQIGVCVLSLNLTYSKPSSINSSSAFWFFIPLSFLVP